MTITIPLLVIAGPTATGKTGAAIRVARAVGGEIISADSMQIYRQLDVGAAKPTRAERSMARFHLVDFVDLDQPYTVADFQRDARAAIREVHGRGSLPILCGGTGLYIRAVLEHFAFPEAEPAEQARVRAELGRELERVGSEAMHRRLEAIDPESGARIGRADAKRIIRALEVFRLTGEPISRRRRVDESPAVTYNSRYFVLDRPRPSLYAAIDARVDEMMSAGWLDEVAGIAAAGHEPGLPSLQAIGYRRLLEWAREGDGGGLGGETSAPDIASVVDSIKRDTRRFAKRQLTWFRRERQAEWLMWSDRNGFGAATRRLCVAASVLFALGGLSPEIRPPRCSGGVCDIE